MPVGNKNSESTRLPGGLIVADQTLKVFVFNRKPFWEAGGHSAFLNLAPRIRPGARGVRRPSNSSLYRYSSNQLLSTRMSVRAFTLSRDRSGIRGKSSGPQYDAEAVHSTNSNCATVTLRGHPKSVPILPGLLAPVIGLRNVHFAAVQTDRELLFPAFLRTHQNLSTTGQSG